MFMVDDVLILCYIDCCCVRIYERHNCQRFLLLNPPSRGQTLTISEKIGWAVAIRRKSQAIGRIMAIKTMKQENGHSMATRIWFRPER